MIFDWSYGFFAIIVPIFMLNLTEERKIIGIIVTAVSGVITSIEATLIVEFLQPFPLLMGIFVSLSILIKCIAMVNQQTFLVGFAGLLISSIIFNLASYDSFDITDFNVNLWVILMASVVIYCLSFLFFPNAQAPEHLNKQPTKTEQNKVEQVFMAWFITMIVFLVFQTFDLIDSLAALISALIILAPMTLAGSKGMGKIRIIGTFIGCLAGLALQIGLGRWFSNPILFWLGFTTLTGLISIFFSRGPIASGIGFSAIAAISVPFTTVLIPEQQDAVYNIFYRFSSIFFAVVVSIIVMHYVQRIIDKRLNGFLASNRTST